MKKVNKIDPSTLRQKAEKLLHEKNSESHLKDSDPENLKLIHELEVHQIELEMQNEELLRAKEQAEVAASKYAELYDFAPSGYFTLSSLGEIIELNFSGASMLGKEQKDLINSRFSFFISDDTKPIFNHFLEKVFISKTKETCDLTLTVNGKPQMYVHLSGLLNTSRDLCLVTAVDITELKVVTELNEMLLSSLPHPAMYIRIKDKVVIAANKIAQDLGVNIGGYCWREFMKESFISQKDKDILAKYPKTVPPELGIKCSHCLADNCFTGSPEQNNPSIHFLGLIWNTYWIKVSDEVYLHYAINITELRKAEETLRESEEQFRILTSLAPAGIYLTDIKGNCEYTNQQWNLMAGMNSKESLGMGWIKRIHPDDREMVFSSWKKMVESEGKWGMEYRFQTPKGKITWVYGLATPQRDDSGKIIRYIGLNMDITKRKLIEETLSRSKLQYDNLVSKIPVGVYILRSKPNGAFALDYVSPRMAEMLNLSVTSLLTYTQNIFEAIHPEDRAGFIKLNQEGIPLRRSFNWKGRIVDGKTVKWMHIMSSPEQQENGELLWHGIIIDITERVHADAEIKKANDELVKLNTDKDRLISIIGHDLKSPFNAILGFLFLLTENIRKYDIDKIEKQLRIINTSAHNVHNLLDNLLIWANSHSGKIPFEPTNHSLTKLCDEVIELLEQNAKEKNVSISNLPSGYISIYADIEMVKTILRNLISNAIKFSHSGGNINVFAEQVDSETRITVFDNGVGISSEAQKTLFATLDLHSTKGTANESGTGLGLTICKDFVEKHGGRIWVKSEEGKGSSFTFTIPNQ